MAKNRKSEEAFKRVVENLLAARVKKSYEAPLFKASLPAIAELSIARDHATMKESLGALEGELGAARSEIGRLEQELGVIALEKEQAHTEREALAQEVEHLKEALREKEKGKTGNEEFERERQRLIGRLAENLSQMERQRALIRELRTEITRLREENGK